MTPRYSGDGWELYVGDCLAVLPGLTGVDAVVTDPPYGKQWARGDNAIGSAPRIAERRESVDWDCEKPPKVVFDTIRAISSRQIIWGGNYFADMLPSSNCWLVWDKRCDLPLMPFADAELAWCSLNSVPRILRHRSHGFIKDTKDERCHPTQKPSEVMEWTLSFLPNAETILDPFTGSGTTGIACIKSGRRFIGIEIDEHYAAIAAKRLARAEADVRNSLPFPEPEPRPKQSTMFEAV